MSLDLHRGTCADNTSVTHLMDAMLQSGIAATSFAGQPGLAIVGVIDAAGTRVLDICQHQGFNFRHFPNISALMASVDTSSLGMGVVLAGVEDTSHQSLDALRRRGVQRAVLVGPSQSHSAYAQALDAGFDEVWPERLDARTLSALFNKAWQTTLKLAKPNAGKAQALGELVLHPESCSCTLAESVAYLSRSCFAVLQCLVLKYPNAVSRADLFMALGKVVPGLDARSRAVDMAVYRLRKQLAAAGMQRIEIKTVGHVGYGIQTVHPLHSPDRHLMLAAR